MKTMMKAAATYIKFLVLLLMSAQVFAAEMTPVLRFSMGAGEDIVNRPLKVVRVDKVSGQGFLANPKCQFFLFQCGISEMLDDPDQLCRGAHEGLSKVRTRGDFLFGHNSPVQVSPPGVERHLVFHQMQNINYLYVVELDLAEEDGKLVLKKTDGKYYQRTKPKKGIFGEKKEWEAAPFRLGRSHWQLSASCAP